MANWAYWALGTVRPQLPAAAGPFGQLAQKVGELRGDLIIQFAMNPHGHLAQVLQAVAVNRSPAFSLSAGTGRGSGRASSSSTRAGPASRPHGAPSSHPAVGQVVQHGGGVGAAGIPLDGARRKKKRPPRHLRLREGSRATRAATVGPPGSATGEQAGPAAAPLPEARPAVTDAPGPTLAKTDGRSKLCMNHGIYGVYTRFSRSPRVLSLHRSQLV